MNLWCDSYALVDKKIEFKLQLKSHNGLGASDLLIFHSHFVPGSDMMLLGIIQKLLWPAYDSCLTNMHLIAFERLILNNIFVFDSFCFCFSICTT